FFFFSSRRRHTRCYRDWSSDVCSSDLVPGVTVFGRRRAQSLAETFQTIGDRQPIDIFHVLVPELAGHTQAERTAVAHGKLTAIRSEERRVGKEGSCQWSRVWSGDNGDG